MLQDPQQRDCYAGMDDGQAFQMLMGFTLFPSVWVHAQTHDSCTWNMFIAARLKFLCWFLWTTWISKAVMFC